MLGSYPKGPWIETTLRYFCSPQRHREVFPPLNSVRSVQISAPPARWLRGNRMAPNPESNRGLAGATTSVLTAAPLSAPAAAAPHLAGTSAPTAIVGPTWLSAAEH